MGHSVHLIIGRGEAVAAFLRQWPVARAVDLESGWRAIPVDQPLHDAIEAAYPGAERPLELDVSPLGVERALVAATEAGGGLAYVETEYFGGAGGQSAMACVDGREVVSPERAGSGGGAINHALRAIGVVRSAEHDEFDTIGLGSRRSMDDYAPEGPVRLRAQQADPEKKPEAEKAYVPLWMVLLVMGAMITVGIFMAAIG